MSIKAHRFSVYVFPQLTLHYFSAILHAVSPEATGRENFATVPSLSVWIVLSLTKGQGVRHSCHFIVC